MNVKKIIKKKVTKKKKGSVNYFLSMIFVLTAILFVSYILKTQMIRQGANKVDDSLVAANLAAATIDLSEYGNTKIIQTTDTEKSYNDFKNCLKKNLNLNNDFSFKEQTVFIGSVNIIDFRIYNVKPDYVQLIEYKDGKKIVSDIKNDVKTPDGVKVVSTTIYSKVGLKIKNLNGQIEYVSKEKSVDVISKEE